MESAGRVGSNMRGSRMEEFCHDVADWATGLPLQPKRRVKMNNSRQDPEADCVCLNRDNDLLAAAKVGHVRCLQFVASSSLHVDFNQVRKVSHKTYQRFSFFYDLRKQFVDYTCMLNSTFKSRVK